MSDLVQLLQMEREVISARLKAIDLLLLQYSGNAYSKHVQTSTQLHRYKDAPFDPKRVRSRTGKTFSSLVIRFLASNPDLTSTELTEKMLEHGLIPKNVTRRRAVSKVSSVICNKEHQGVVVKDDEKCYKLTPKGELEAKYLTSLLKQK